MLIYNITTQITWRIALDWITWMKEKHIPEIMTTGCFTDYRFVKLLETDETEGPTYAIQFYVENAEQYNLYLDVYAPGLRDDTGKQWGDQFISFRSLMEVVN